MLPILLIAAVLVYVNEPVVDMRENPTSQSQVVSQALFSEKVTVKKTIDEWSSIQTPDGYSGWVISESLVDRNTPYETQSKTSRLRAHVYGIMDTELGPIKSLPYGSRLQVLDVSDSRWVKVKLPDDHECYIQKGDLSPEPQLSHKSELVDFNHKFLGLPYTWGGRSSFGYDCSGFVQMLYSQIGIDLERDARQQILDRRFRTIKLEQIEPGDLIFFGQSADKIKHVGLSIGQGQFIHATPRENQPWIRISHLSDAEWSGHEKTNYPYRTARQLIEK